MALPDVPGWIIDYRTASAIYEAGQDDQVEHCDGKCACGELCFCSPELEYFKAHDLLVAPFVNDNDCMIVVEGEIMAHSQDIMEGQYNKALRSGGESVILLASTAIHLGFGVISDHTSTMFVTVWDICPRYGLPVMTSAEYFAAL